MAAWDSSRKLTRHDDKEAQTKIEKALKDAFRPEFLNRIDEVIMFSPLTMDDMRKIVELQMKEVEGRLAEHGLKVKLTDKAKEWLANAGYDTNFGARPLRRVLQKHVESPLSVKLLSGEYADGDTVGVDVDADDKIVFQKQDTGKKEKTSRVEEKAQA